MKVTVQRDPGTPWLWGFLIQQAGALLARGSGYDDKESAMIAANREHAKLNGQEELLPEAENERPVTRQRRLTP